MESGRLPIVIRPPLRGIRLVLGLLFVLAAAVLVIRVDEATTERIAPVVVAFGLLVVGTLLAFLERTVSVDASRGEVSSCWGLLGITLQQKTVRNVGRIDRVVISVRREPLAPDSGTVWVADRSFPVLLCAGDRTLFRVNGWPPDASVHGKSFEAGYPTSAFFPSYSRHVGALLAEALRVPLEDRIEGRTYAAGEIPGDWLDPGSVGIRMMWRRH